MDSLEKIKYLTHYLELARFAQAKKFLIIATIVLAVLIILRIIMKDFQQLKATKKLVTFLLIAAIIIWFGVLINFIYRYYPVYLYENDYNAWYRKVLDDTIKTMK